MIGRFGDQVTHLPTGKRGKVVMHPSGSIGVFSTAVDLGNGTVVEFPDSELRVCQNDGNLTVSGMRFASKRAIPPGMMVQLWNNGDGTVKVVGKVPGGPTVTIHDLPLIDGEVVLPDDAFFPIKR